ncbi:hypothetical protein [Tenuifilum sp.]|uniref:hypothetical protein n=1 Tax=Tenuifilum sp. TaxID=2760880 RepID=UPI00259006E9|nr:hypothetical protein [Tenuifilum sp.]
MEKLAFVKFIGFNYDSLKFYGIYPLVELNPPSRVAVSKLPDSFYTPKLLTKKIEYEKEIGF